MGKRSNQAKARLGIDHVAECKRYNRLVRKESRTPKKQEKISE